jgi:hypothetical protein
MEKEERSLTRGGNQAELIACAKGSRVRPLRSP